jgi:hypothetical protein
MRLLLIVLLALAGCSEGSNDGGSLQGRVNGVYTTFGGAVLHR